MFGYCGRMLLVNLETMTFEIRELEEAILRDFLGGPSLGARIMYDLMPANTDAFASESVLGFVTGPCNGSGVLLGGRYTVVSKSPVYDGFNDANSGGTFASALKGSGFDAVFFTGIAPNPVYLFIDEGKPEIRSAEAVWGLGITDAEECLKKEIGDSRIGISLIGPAGERMAHTAAVMNDKHRAAGRGGSGAVMGSKRLKAVCVKGSFRPPIFDNSAKLKYNKQSAGWEKDGPVSMLCAAFSQKGTGNSYESSVICGDAGIRNWRGSGVDDISEDARYALSSAGLDERYKVSAYRCDTCPIGCGAIYELRNKDGLPVKGGRPEYEAQGLFGCFMLNDDPSCVCLCNDMVNEAGLDVISIGATVGWAMDAFESGELSLADLDGISLNWGAGDAIVAITKKIADGDGVGAVLQNGSLYSSNHFGRGFNQLAVASGIELPMHDPKFAPGLARTYKYDPTPGRHVKGGLTFKQGFAPPEVKYNYDTDGLDDLKGTIDTEIVNAAGFCQFASFALAPGAVVGLINSVTGFNYTEEEINMLGKRSFLMRHAFNLREGKRRKDWTLSERIISDPPDRGPLAGIKVDVEKLADNFFKAFGFDIATAVPMPEILDTVGGLDFLKKDLYP